MHDTITVNLNLLSTNCESNLGNCSLRVSLQSAHIRGRTEVPSTTSMCNSLAFKCSTCNFKAAKGLQHSNTWIPTCFKALLRRGCFSYINFLAISRGIKSFSHVIVDWYLLRKLTLMLTQTFCSDRSCFAAQTTSHQEEQNCF